MQWGEVLSLFLLLLSGENKGHLYVLSVAEIWIIMHVGPFWTVVSAFIFFSVLPFPVSFLFIVFVLITFSQLGGSDALKSLGSSQY